MPRLEHDRYCDEIVAQTDLLRGVVAGADLSVIVPTTPDWTLGALLRHIGGNLRALELAVRGGEAVTEPERQVPGHAGPDGDDPAALDAWLAEGAEACAGALRAAGPAAEAQVWTFRWPGVLWSRRAANDLAVHRADAAGAVRAGYQVAPDLAADAIEELLELMSNPAVAASSPRLAELGQREGSSLHLHATDPGVEAEWLIELGAAGFSWRHGHERAGVAVRGPLEDLLRVVYRRLPPDAGRVEVLGDADLLRFWLGRVSLS
jgi:uncharacterized protein (TIGR03083 family)